MSIYGALLHLYPSSFRKEYGDEMRAVFVARQQQTSGAVATIALWLDVVTDVVTNAAAVHWDLLCQDLRYTARTLGRAPGFAITAILVTALGVGANTAAFSVADFVLIRPLPFADAERLVTVWEHPPGYDRMELSPPNYRDWKSMNRSFQAMGAYHFDAVNFVGDGDPERLDAAVVNADLLQLLGVPPLLGRVFTAEEEREDVAGTVVLSYGLWQSALGGDRAVLGKRLLLDGAPHVVIGVMPRDFHFPNRTVALWRPMSRRELNYDDRTDNFFSVLARLRPDVTLDQARADMAMVAARLEREYPKENEKVGASVFRLHDDLSQQSRLLLIALCGASVCVLLIACANLANLLLARALARRRELVVRAALGAGRERLVRQLVTESLLLAVLGGALGIVVAIIAVPLLARLVPNSLPIAQSPAVDLRLLLFAALLTGITGIGFGVFPALRASGSTALGALRDDTRSGGDRRSRLRSALVIAEVTATVVLLISSALLMRALWTIQATDPGFRAEGVLTLRTALPSPQYDSVARRERFYSEVLSGVSTLPGISSAAYVSFLPMTFRGGIWQVSTKGQRARVRSASQVASARYATPGYFGTLGIPLRRGRDVSATDAMGRPFVAVVSESFVRQFFPGVDPLGQHFEFGMRDRMIVGVVADVRVRGLERGSEPQVYLPHRQVGDGEMLFYAPKDLALRITATPASLIPSIRRIVHAADPLQPISNLRLMSEVIADETASRAVQVRVLGAFAAVAFLLAAIGIHGLLSFTVSNRRHEIGVRMALGAQPGVIVRMVMRQSVLLAAAGVLPGVALAYAAGRSMRSLLAGVEPGDATTFVAVVALCVMMTLLGSLFPVLRAVRVTPASVFRGGA